MAQTGEAAERVSNSSGLEMLQQVFRQGGFVTGMGKTLGLLGKEAMFGKVTIEGSPTEDHLNPLGTVHGGYAATMLDTATALAVFSTLNAKARYSTLDLKITYLRPLSLESGPLRATATVLHSGRSVATAEAQLLDREDRLCAHAVAICIVVASVDAGA